MTLTGLGRVILVRPLRLSGKGRDRSAWLGGWCAFEGADKGEIIEFAVRRILLVGLKRWISRLAVMIPSHGKTTLLLVSTPRIEHSRCTLEMVVESST